MKKIKILLEQEAGLQQVHMLYMSWVSRADDQHWEKKDWPIHQEPGITERNIAKEKMVNRGHITMTEQHNNFRLLYSL